MFVSVWLESSSKKQSVIESPPKAEIFELLNLEGVIKLKYLGKHTSRLEYEHLKLPCIDAKQ